MPWKQPLFIVGILLLGFEVASMLMMPDTSVLTAESPNSFEDDFSSLIYVMGAFTASFIAFFILLISSVIFILRGTVRKHAWMLFTMLLAFVLPIFWYYS